MLVFWWAARLTLTSAHTPEVAQSAVGANKAGSQKDRPIAMSTDRDSRPRFSDVTVAMLGESKLIFIAGQVAENAALDITGQTREILAC